MYSGGGGGVRIFYVQVTFFGVVVAARAAADSFIIANPVSILDQSDIQLCAVQKNAVFVQRGKNKSWRRV